MSFVNQIRMLDKKYALSLFIGLIFGGVTVYATFFYIKKPRIRFEILSSTNVVDVQEKVSALKIIYQKEDILKEGKLIRIYSVRLRNVGSIDINKSYYDSRDPIGLDIKNGDIIDTVEITEASSDYLKKKIGPLHINSNSIIFTDPLMNSDDFITFKVLVLHAKDSVPKLLSKGTVSGISHIPVVNLYEISEQKSLWGQIWDANMWVCCLRFIAYFMIFILASLIVTAPIIFFVDYFSKRKRGKIFVRFKKSKSNLLTPEALKFIEAVYIQSNVDINTIKVLLDNKEELKKTLRYLEISNGSSCNVISASNDCLVACSLMMKVNVIKWDNNDMPIIPDDILKGVNAFITFIKNN